MVVLWHSKSKMSARRVLLRRVRGRPVESCRLPESTSDVKGCVEEEKERLERKKKKKKEM